MVSKHKAYLLPGRNEGRSKKAFRELRISTLWTSKGYMYITDDVILCCLLAVSFAVLYSHFVCADNIKCSLGS